MANVRISDLPDAITPLDTTTTFFEVQAVEGGVDVSRRVRGDMITFTVFPPPTVDGSIVRGNTTSQLYEETPFVIVSDNTANSVTLDGPANNGSTLTIMNINATTGFDSVIQFRELTAPVTRLFYDASEGDFKVRINNPGLIRLEEGNGTVRLADFDSITGQQTLWAGTAGSDVPVMRTVLPASGGLEVDNQVTGAGFERVLTTSDGGASLPSGVQGDIAFISTAPNTYTATSAVSIDPATTASVVTLEVGSGGGDGAVRVTGGATGANFGIGPTGATLSNALSMSYAGLAGVNIFQMAMGDNNVDTTDGTFQMSVWDGTAAAAEIFLRATGASGVQLRFDGDPILETISNGMTLGATGSANTGIFLQNTASSTRATMIVDHTSGDLIIDSRINLGTITFQGRDSSSNTDNFMQMVPESGVELFFNGLRNFRGRQTGVEIQSTVAGATVLDFQDSGAATTAQINSNAGLITIDGLVATAGFGLLVRTRDSGGTARTLIRGNANNDVELYFAGTEVFRTVAAASGGAEANNTATGAGFERVLTTSDLASGGAQISGTPANNQVGVWVNATDIEGATDMTWNGSTLALGGTMIQLDNSGAATFTATEMFNSAGGVQFGVDSGGQAQIEQTDNAGAAEETWMEFNRSAGVSIRHNNNVRLVTTTTGIDITGAAAGTQLDVDGSGSANGTEIIARNSEGGWRQRANGDTFELIQTDSAGSVEDTWILCTADSDVALFNNGTEVARTLTAASGGFEVNNTLTGAGFERVLTASDLGGGLVTRRKAADQTINNDTTPTIDGDLDISSGLDNTETYAVEVGLVWSQSASGPDGLEFQSNYAHTTRDFIATAQYLDGTTTTMTRVTDNVIANLPDSTGAGLQRLILIQGSVINATAYGVRWAQNVSDAADTILREGSWLKLALCNN